MLNIRCLDGIIRVRFISHAQISMTTWKQEKILHCTVLSISKNVIPYCHDKMVFLQMRKKYCFDLRKLI